MNTLDWSILVIYLALMILLSFVAGRGQSSQDDYYVGGRDLPWWAVAVSTMATQTSAISFISIPAFVALREGGGLTWLQYELAVPLAMLFIMVFLLPLFRRLELISVYEYLELRFGPGTRSLLSAVFLLSRGLGTGALLYASGIVLSLCLGTSLGVTIVIIGLVTLVYDCIGGIKAVVFSDVVQMVVLLIGVGLCISGALGKVGGWEAALAMHEPARFETLNGGLGLSGGATFPFWPFFLGGFFLYASYYGCDQSQVQRVLATRSEGDMKYALFFNGFARLPLTLVYVALGLAVGAVFKMDADAMALLPEGQIDYMIPTFVLHYLPHGFKGILFAALLAATMSSVDSSINSLSAATMRDFVERHLRPDPRHLLWYGRATTVVWGLLIIAFAFTIGGSDTIVEQLNKIGSAFYGPILATFVTGVFSRRVTGRGMVLGILTGVGANVVLWLGFENVFWMWWNVVGCLVAIVAARVCSGRQTTPPPEHALVSLRGLWPKERAWLPTYGVLLLYFIGMLVALALLPSFISAFV